MNNDKIRDHYLLALVDIANGKNIMELEEAIDDYEELEEYEACAGILKAIHESGYLTIKDLIKIIDKDE